METNLLDRMLNTYLSSMTPVCMTLRNKIRVNGIIKAFDSYIIIIEGQKREIVYRHAVSSLAASTELKKKSSPEKSSRPPRTPAQGPHSPQQTPVPASPSVVNINNSMKEGLLKWMQEQKAAK